MSNSKMPKEAANVLGGLASKTLVILVGGLFVLDLFVPDALPFVDEIVLGIITVLMARWQSRRPRVTPEPARKPETRNVTPS